MENRQFNLKDFGLSIRKMMIPVIFLCLVNQFAYWFSRLIIAGRATYDFSFAFENDIPLVPWTSLIYLGCYVYWFLNIALACYQKEEEAYRLFCAEAFGKMICFFFFIIIPTATTRPEITELNTIWDHWMKFIYDADPANNLFPSLHCYMSTICILSVWFNPQISKIYKWLSVVITAMICLSTLTTKQHFLVDIPAGILLAIFSYWFVKKVNLVKPYTWLMKKCTPKKFMVDIYGN